MKPTVIGMLFRNNEKLVFPLVSLILKSMTTRLPIIAFDDCSEDNTVSELMKILDEESVDNILLSKEHVGISKGRNKIIEAARNMHPDGFNLILLDSDIVIAKHGFFDELISRLYSANSGVICVKLKSFYADIPDNHGIACCIIRSEVIEKIKGFDEQFYMFFDDSDFWKRTIEEARYSVWNINEMECIHIWGSTVTTGSEGNKKESIYASDKLAYLRKWGLKTL